jgi:hypothetical protein
VPVTDTVAEAVPTGMAAGAICEIAGLGLSTSRFTGVPEALVRLPFSATIGIRTPCASCAAGTDAVTCVALT